MQDWRDAHRAAHFPDPLASMTPCRVGTVLLKEAVERVRAGLCEPLDIDRFREMGKMMKAMSRCGLGQTAPNPVLSTLENFPALYASCQQADPDGYRRSFDLAASVTEARALAGRAEPAPAGVEQKGGRP